MATKGMTRRPAQDLGRIGWLAGVAVLAWGVTAGLSARDDTPGAPPALPPDLARVPADGMLFVSLRFGDLWQGERAKQARRRLPREVQEIERDFERAHGLKLDDVERFTVAQSDLRSPEPLLIVSTTRPFDRAKVLAALGRNVKEEKHKGQSVYVGSPVSAAHLLGERALVFGRPREVIALVESPAAKDGNLSAALRLAEGKHLLVASVNVHAVAEVLEEELPPEIAPLKPLFKALTATATFDLDPMAEADFRLAFAREVDAREAHKAGTAALKLAQTMLAQGIEANGKDKRTATVAGLLKLLQASLKEVPIEQKGPALHARVRVKADTATVEAALGEAVQKVRQASLRMKTSNNLQQIALACHNYVATFNRLPPHAVYNKDGKLLYSWRVLILPYLEEGELYKQFHLDEAWDSEHNKKLLVRMPKVYGSPADPNSFQTGKTHYVGFVGKGAAFEGKQGLRFPADFPDGTSNTILAVEASKSVPWTSPEDLPFDPARPVPSIGGLHEGGFLAALCDGSVRFIKKSISETTLKYAITRNDGQVLGPDF
jgi:hypothetical protein